MSGKFFNFLIISIAAEINLDHPSGIGVKIQ